MICDEALQLGDQCLSFRGSGGQMADLAKFPENIHELLRSCLHIFAVCLGFIFLVSCRAAPFFLGFPGITVNLFCVKCSIIHRYHSCFLNFSGVGDEVFQMLLLQFQKLDLLLQGFHDVKTGRIQDLLNVFQRKL